MRRTAIAGAAHGNSSPSRCHRTARSWPTARTGNASSSASPSGSPDRDLRADLRERQVDVVLDALELTRALADPRSAPQLPGPGSWAARIVDHDVELGVVDLFFLRHARDRVRVDQQRTGDGDLVQGVACDANGAQVLHVTWCLDILE